MSLTSTQYQFLKMIHKKAASMSKTEKRFPNYQKNQDFFDPSFQNYFFRKDDMFYITTEGKREFETKRTEWRRWFIPVLISVFALAFSIFSIALQYLR